MFKKKKHTLPKIVEVDESNNSIPQLPLPPPPVR